MTQENTGAIVSPEQLEQINRFARRELLAEEVYVFSLILCDNEVDRDFERFPAESVEKLAELFLGKTGIFDHDPKGENQTARIFAAGVERDESRVTTAGEPYCALRAWAYMVRCDKNADLILEIDAGIKKEVSVGCAVAKALCSICGADMRQKPCTHQKGQEYDGQLCWHELCEPVDAYEWSFVAVPAQKLAGITKRHGGGDPLIKSLERGGGGITLDAVQAASLAARLREAGEWQRQRLDGLRKQLVRQGAFFAPELDPAALERTAAKMDEAELVAFCKGFSKGVPPVLQLGGGSESDKPDFRAFQI